MVERDIVAAYTVLPKMFDIKTIEIPIDESIIYQMDSIWKYRIKELAKSKWEPLQKGRQLEFCNNCRPAFCLVHSPTVFCNLRQVCPFCYARYMAEIYRKLYTKINELDDKGNDYQLSCYKKVKRLPVGRTNLTKIYQSRASYRIKMLALVNPDAALFSHNLYPAPYLSKPVAYWQLENSVLFMTKKGTILPDQIGLHVKSVPYTRRNFSISFLKVMKYPIGYLFGDPDLTVEALHARKHFRLIESTGEFRASAPLP